MAVGIGLWDDLRVLCVAPGKRLRRSDPVGKAFGNDLWRGHEAVMVGAEGGSLRLTFFGPLPKVSSIAAFYLDDPRPVADRAGMARKRHAPSPATSARLRPRAIVLLPPAPAARSRVGGGSGAFSIWSRRLARLHSARPGSTARV